MHKDSDKNKLARYMTGNFTLLEMMGLLALFGVILTMVLRYYFGS